MLTEATLTAFATLANTVLQISLAHFNAMSETDKSAQVAQERALAQPWIDLGLKCAGLFDKLFHVPPPPIPPQ